MFEHLKQMNAEMEAFKTTYLEKSKAAFSEVAKMLFEKHPVLESFSWQQYTPYFNDGDECVFSARTDEPDMNGLDYYDDNLYNKLLDYDGKPRKDFDAAINSAYEDVKTFLSQFDDTVLRDLFGDHKTVTVGRNSTEVENYSHE